MTYQPYQPVEQYPRQPGNSSAWKWFLAIAAAFVALLVGLLIGYFMESPNSTATAAPTTTTATSTAPPQTVTATATATQTVTATATETQRATERQSEPTQQQQQSGGSDFPPPPGQAGAGMEWATMGPFSSEWTCTQRADSWPTNSPTCFAHEGQWYFWGMRQAG